MPSYKKYQPANEKELHEIIEKDIEGVEKGLVVLAREYSVRSGVLDFLCVDDAGQLVIIEVKLAEDDYMLFQSLRYYADVERDRFIFPARFPDANIEPDELPRILLIARGFSDSMKRYTTLVTPYVELYTYICITGPSNQRGIVFDSVPTPSGENLPLEAPSIEKLRSYINDSDLQVTFDAARKRITEIGNDIEEYATTGYVGFKYRGRQFAWIKPFRNSLEIGAHKINENRGLEGYEGVRIESEGEDCSEVIENIKVGYQMLGGELN